MNHQSERRYVLPMLLRYEARHCGGAVLAVPPLAGALTGAVTSLVSPSWHSLLAGNVLPILVALPSASTVVGDAARELHATVPRRYVWTVSFRLALSGGAIVAGVVVATVLSAALGSSPDVLGFAASALCAASLLVGVAAMVGVSFPSTAAASSVMIAVWLARLLAGERVLGDGALGLVVPAGIGCAAIAWALHRLDSTDGVIGTCRDGVES